MLVDVRPAQRLRGKRPVDVTASLGPVLEALRDEEVDLTRLRVVCDWIQYRNNFRDVIDLRPILQDIPADSPARALLAGGPAGPPAAPAGPDRLEVAIDLRRAPDVPLEETARAVLRGHTDPDGPHGAPRVHLEGWGPLSASCVWAFNALYWGALEHWEHVTGRVYEQALPGGESDARNVAAVRELIGGLFATWDELGARNALPEQLFVVELGVGNGSQARTFLDEFATLDQAHGTDYYGRLHYLLCDYSPHVLELAQKAVAHHGERTSALVLNAVNPTATLAFLRRKVFLVYVSNVYDNLPTDEVARIGGRNFQVETRAYLAAEDARAIAADARVEPSTLPAAITRLLKLGPAVLSEALPATFPTVAAAVAFWQRVWQAVRLEERYVPLIGLDGYEIAPRLSGEVLRPLLEADGDIRMHVSNGAAASFDNTLPLLHPHGRLHCHDLFVTDPHAYRTGYRGPGKYDGSVVNWVNGPLLAHIGSRKGFDVRFVPFAHHPGSNVLTLTAQTRG
jgi:hypothetical protein